MPSKVYVLGHKYVLGPSQTHFRVRVRVTGLGSGLAARAKMSLSRAENIFMPANINSVVILLLAIGRRNQLNPHGFFVQILSLCS